MSAIRPVFDFFRDPPPLPTAPTETRPRRARRHPCGYFIRKVKGELYQLRWWISGYGSVNCGLYAESDAEMVRSELVRETRHHPCTPLGLWQGLVVVLGRLAVRFPAARWPRVLPRYVRRLETGGYWARVKKRGRVLTLSGPFGMPGEAHTAMVGLLERLFPRPRRLEPRRPKTLLDVAPIAA